METNKITVRAGRRHVSYVEIPASEVPAGIRFDISAEQQGQMQQVAYGRPAQERSEAIAGAKYRRFSDSSVAVGQPGRVIYYRLTGAQEQS